MTYLFQLVLFALVFNRLAFATQIKENRLKGFSWATCDELNVTTTISYIDIYPDPVVFPGPLHLDLKGVATQDMNAPAKLVTLLERFVVDSWVEIPCSGKAGSCTFDDICYIMSVIFPPQQPCPESMTSTGTPCHCPIKAGSVDITGFTLNLFLDTIPDLLTGDYHLKFSFFSDSMEITCFHVYFSILIA